jgi:predicted outer membrane repeat protein
MLFWLISFPSAAMASTITVGAGADFPTISEAVVVASSGDVIEVGAGTYSESVDLGGKSLVLRGTSGALLTTISPTSSLAAITMDSSEASVTIEGFTLAPAGGGRGLFIAGTSPMISNMVIEGAGTDGSGQGGGAYVSAGSPTFDNVVFRDNYAAMGGDLYVTIGADVQLTDCTLNGARTNFGGSLYVVASTVRLTDTDSNGSSSRFTGGFAYLDNGANLVASNVQVSDSQSDGGHAGAVFAKDHSVIFWTDGGVSDATLLALSYSGGAFFLSDSCSFVGTDITIDGGTAGAGGAMYVEDGSSATCVGCRFLDNVAAREGGGIAAASTSDVSCVDCLFDGNTGERGGGVDLTGDAAFSDTNSTFTSNEATDQDGGAVRVTNGSEIAVTGTTFTGNSAGQAGGAIYISSPGDAVVIEGASFSVNTADNGDGGAICADRDTDLSIQSCTFDDNQSTFGSGGALAFDVIAAGFLVEISDSRFEDNEAGQDGGAVSAEGADLVAVTDTDFVRNRAPSGSGGALFLDASEDQRFLRSRFHANLADDAGGAVAEEQSTGTSEFENCIFTENIGGNGGAIYRKNASIQADIVNNTFAGNDGESLGAHVFIDGATVSFTNNIAWDGQDGGGLYASGASDALGSDFYYNDVGNNSGGQFTGALSDPTGTSGNVTANPLFRDYTIDGDEGNDNLYLLAGSPCIDQGDPSLADVDGTRSDIGAFGGPNADADDGDGDGHYDITDCNDEDSDIHPGAEEVPYDGIDQDCDGLDLTDLDSDGFDAEEVGGEDCDDDDASVNPDGVEVWYDGVDSDCDGGSDYDADEDGYDSDVYGGRDCDDADPSYKPSAADTVGDGEDQNCDGIDGTDADGDGYAADGGGGDDCDDADIAVHPGAVEVPYDGIDQDCADGDLVDVDGDGVDAEAAGGEDCDDDDAAVYPGATEVWYDGVDANCDGRSDYDADGDGFDSDAPLHGGDDCDDTDPGVAPEVEEIWYDGIDQNCDGESDYDQDEDGRDAVEFDGNDCVDTDASVHPGAAEVPYDGIDQDCSGDDLVDVDNDGFDAVEVDGGTDCDDGELAVNPSATEVWYDGVDSDCAGDDDFDADADGFVPDAHEGAITETVNTGSELPPGDCNDSDGEVHPGAEDAWYDGVDANCDGASDYDADGDGFDTSEYFGDDCDDDENTTYPGAEELLDGVDNDCDGLDEMADRDEDEVPDWYEWLNETNPENPDSDGDGWNDGQEYGNDLEVPQDTDGDGQIDALDIDDDGDRIPTEVEQSEDVNGDEIPDQDVDRDGIPNALDTDSDGDRYSDREEGVKDLDFDGIPDYLDYQGDFVGGGCTGCSNTGSGSGGFWLMLIGLVGVLQRRRAVLAGLLCSPVAFGQTFESPPIDAHGFWVAETSGDPARSVRLVYPAIGDGWAAGLLIDYASNPLREKTRTGRSEVLVDTLVTSHLYGAYDWEGLRLDGSLPITAYGHDQVGGFAASGDMRLGVLWPFLGLDGTIPGVGVQALAWLPTGTRTRWSGSPGFGSGAVLTMAQQIDRFGYTVNAGLRLGVGGEARNVQSGSSPIGGLDLNYTLPVMNDGLGVGVDAAIQGSTGFSRFPLEPGLHVRGRLENGGFAVLGSAMGMGDAVGASELRVYAGLGYGGIPEKAESTGTIVVPVIMERIERLREDGPLAQLVDNRILLREQVFFKEAKAELMRASEPVLEAVLVVLQNHTEIEHLLVEGHTNSRASRAYNRRLSQARAEAVCAWLELRGIDGARLIAKGFGEDRPLVKDSHSDAMVINRRVEFTVLRSDEAGEAEALPDVQSLPEELREDR